MQKDGLSGLSECLHQPFKLFTEGIINVEVMSVFIMDAGSSGVKMQDVLMNTWRIRDLTWMPELSVSLMDIVISARKHWSRKS